MHTHQNRFIAFNNFSGVTGIVDFFRGASMSKGGKSILMLTSKSSELDRVLGGGLVEGSVVLLGGEPGVGKSTLLTGLALWWVRRGLRVIYVAGEESPAQIRMRAERPKIPQTKQTLRSPAPRIANRQAGIE